MLSINRYFIACSRVEFGLVASLRSHKVCISDEFKHLLYVFCDSNRLEIFKLLLWYARVKT
ncbi:hypothetical protein V1477_010578 [Vespula maculifrons]|uniref:Uncharacterized protein n=1 Tax=Vespula maculifrons TaxID=7453 RepID=A0ABD2C2G6_VESMC